MGFVQNMKDSALAMAMRKLIAEKFPEYGEVLDCSVDTEKNRIVLQALLRGERTPITATIDRYDIVQEAGDTFIVLHKLSASREWLAQLLARLGEGKRFKIPLAVSKLL